MCAGANSAASTRKIANQSSLRTKTNYVCITTIFPKQRAHNPPFTRVKMECLLPIRTVYQSSSRLFPDVTLFEKQRYWLGLPYLFILNLQPWIPTRYNGQVLLRGVVAYWYQAYHTNSQDLLSPRTHYWYCNPWSYINQCNPLLWLFYKMCRSQQQEKIANYKLIKTAHKDKIYLCYYYLSDTKYTPPSSNVCKS